MKMTLRFFTIGILSLLVFGMATSTQPAWACSGTGSTVEEDIDYSEFIARGTIGQIDDSEKNGIFSISEYLKGQGEGVILLSSYSPENTLKDQIYYRGGCYHGMKLMKNVEVIMFFSKNLDGSYTPLKYYVDNQRIMWSRSVPTFVLSLDELSQAITYNTQSIPYTPREDYSYYPLFAPLLIITQSGSEYLFPIDRSNPTLLEEDRLNFLPHEKSACWEANCNAISLTYRITLKPETVHDGSGSSRNLNGNAFLLSPQAPFIAVWWENKIQIFSMNPPSSENAFDLVAETPIYADSIIPNSAVWSPNEQIIVFADNRGIMLWDVFTEGAEPILIYETNIKTIQGFSPLERFLVIGDHTNGVSIDLISGETYPVGVFSPMENYLLSYQTNQLLQFIPHQLRDMSELYSPIHKIQWLSNNSWIALACNSEDNPASCNIIRENTGRISEPIQTQGYTFDYDMQNRLLAMVINEYQITIEQTLGEIPLIITWIHEYDLSPYLDSPIASIEWLPSLFYYDD
jgi:hypothetical protein